VRYFLSLGSNLGNKKKNLARAIFFLKKKGTQILRASSHYKTQPVDVLNQPWFLNQVIEIESNLNPFALLRAVKNIEEKMGRKPTVDKGPRVIDIDLLLAENAILHTKNLIIPHPRLAQRNFTLAPLAEIAPEAIHPVLKAKMEDLWKNSKDRSIVKKIKIGLTATSVEKNGQGKALKT
jgi:2-amino-4-hydroxy-6-hydroxymethyldihydropteridine diphosphokinase